MLERYRSRVSARASSGVGESWMMNGKHGPRLLQPAFPAHQHAEDEGTAQFRDRHVEVGQQRFVRLGLGEQLFFGAVQLHHQRCGNAGVGGDVADRHAAVAALTEQPPGGIQDGFAAGNAVAAGAGSGTSRATGGTTRGRSRAHASTSCPAGASIARSAVTERLSTASFRAMAWWVAGCSKVTM